MRWKLSVALEAASESRADTQLQKWFLFSKARQGKANEKNREVLEPEFKAESHADIIGNKK